MYMLQVRLQVDDAMIKINYMNLLKNFYPCTVAAAFFCTYELTKRFLGPHLPDAFAPVVHMTAATAGEVVSACN